MDKTIQVKDKRFAVSIPEEQIRREVQRVAAEITRDHAGEEPVFLVVLNGAFIFAADLVREVNLPCEISFVRLASYQGMASTGIIREIVGLSVDVTNRPVVIVEDIVDTGLTMAYMLDMLQKHNPSSIDVCALLVKPEKLEVDIDIRYRCFDIPNDFILGYGLDYDELARNTKDIYTLVHSS